MNNSPTPQYDEAEAFDALYLALSESNEAGMMDDGPETDAFDRAFDAFKEDVS